jgi:hypothetical protein
MIAKWACDVDKGSDFHEKSIDGTLTCASSCAVARVTFHSELFLWIIINNFFIRRLPYHPETHNGWCADGIEGGPLRLVNHRNIFHLERCGLPVRANDKSALRNWDDPIQARRRNWRMKIVNLILRSSLPLK